MTTHERQGALRGIADEMLALVERLDRVAGEGDPAADYCVCQAADAWAALANLVQARDESRPCATCGGPGYLPDPDRGGGCPACRGDGRDLRRPAVAPPDPCALCDGCGRLADAPCHRCAGTGLDGGAETEAAGEPICSTCSGTGEGRADCRPCPMCAGSGVEP